MANLLTDGAGVLASWLQDYVTTQVTYSRSGTASDTINATLRQREYMVTGFDGLQTAVVSSDWIVDVDDVVVSGSTLTPRAGDRITAGSAVYEVMPIDGRQAWRYWDSANTAYVIHTKQVT